jgi:hypothetical protein
MLTTARSTLRTRIQSARSFPNSANQEVRTKIFIFLVRRHHRSSPRVWQKPTDQRCIDCATHDHFGAHIGVIRRNGVPGNQGSIWMSVPHRAKCRRSSTIPFRKRACGSFHYRQGTGADGSSGHCFIHSIGNVAPRWSKRWTTSRSAFRLEHANSPTWVGDGPAGPGWALWSRRAGRDCGSLLCLTEPEGCTVQLP